MKGKCKKDFEKWLKKKYKEIDIGYPHDLSGCQSLNDAFKYLPHSMQWGVIVDFFDSVGIYIEVQYYSKSAFMAHFYINKEEGEYDRSLMFKTRYEARAAAIEKATEIYNERS